MHPIARLLTWGEPIARRVLRLEHGANCGPLLHVACYYTFLTVAAWPSLVTHPALRAGLWVLVVLLNYSLSIGIMHMHAHRRLFSDARLNRAMDLLLCLPAGGSYTTMLYSHVLMHHRYLDGPEDPTTTRGAGGGWPMLRYWLGYAMGCTRATGRFLSTPEAQGPWIKLRRQHQVDRSAFVLMQSIWFVLDPITMLTFGLVPALLCHLNVGYFAWLTHGPAGDGPINGSLNTVNNWMGLFVFNQGYHAVHHAHPGVHWSRIPDHLDMMEEVEDDYIVPYWVTFTSAWRGLRPHGYCDPRFGRRWKARLADRRRSGRARLSWLPYFSWI
ncbi:MAG: fatty acid desaturase [Alphaproteobacteria bacterium]|nr:fatty acid desaturase [Polyangiaceae bacterium]MCB9764775.1 fatty acid desaturase [Alphaproteobacteria bacterium]